jgi:serine/threonine protein kinase/Leucine-rich repeat (LRR) protein
MHPPRDELAGYAFGTLPDDRLEAIAEHVERCTTCEDTVRHLESTGDDVLGQLRQPPPSEPFVSESGCERVLALIDAIGREPSFTHADRTERPGRSEDSATPPDSDLGQVRVYKLLAKLGEGGMGAVYKALHTELDKIVALKILPSDRLQDRSAVDRFKREMKAIGKLEHPNLVRAMDAGEDAGTHYLVMELIDGVDLAALVKQRGPLPVAEACEIIRQAAIGLQYAHERGLVHRDIKPSNLMVSGEWSVVSGDESGKAEGGSGKSDEFPTAFPLPPSHFHHSPLTTHYSPTIKILDMGLALLAGQHVEGSPELTTTGQIMGTVDYMAPEQAGDTHSVDIRADLYSLGATLYKLLTGRAPFEGPQFNTPLKKLAALASASPRPIRELRPEVPEELAAIVHRLLAKTPDERPATPRAVAELLAPFASTVSLSQLFQPTTSTTAAEKVPESDCLTTPTVIAETAVRPPVVPELEGLATLARKPIRRPPTPRRRWWWTAPAAGLLLLAAGLVFQVQFNQGTLIVEVLDDSVAAQLTTTGLLVRNTETNREYRIRLAEGQTTGTQRVPPGKYEVAEAASLVITDDAGASMTAKSFELTRGKQRLLRVSLAPPVAQENYALHLDGERAYVQLPLRYDGTHPITVEMWCVPKDVEIEADKVYRLAKIGNLHLSLKGIPLLWSSSIWGTDVDRVVLSEVYPAFVPQRGEPLKRFHLACSWDGTTLAMFVNGRRAFVSNRKLEPGIRAEHIAERFREDATHAGDHTLGRGDPDPQEPQRSFPGEIDEIRISNVVRYLENFTPAERFEPDSATLALYHCDEGDGATLQDASGKGHHGQLIGATWRKVVAAARAAPLEVSPSVSPSGSFALHFENVTDYVLFPLRYDGTHPITVEAWCEGVPTDPSKFHPVFSNQVLYLQLNGAESLWASAIWDGENSRGYFVNTAPYNAPAPGELPARIHLASQWDGAMLTMFVNGRRASINATPGQEDQARALSLLSRQRSFFLGRGINNLVTMENRPSGLHSLRGEIDEVRFSNVIRYTGDFTPQERFEPDEHTIALYHCDEGHGDLLVDSSGNKHHGIIVGPTWVRQAPTGPFHVDWDFVRRVEQLPAEEQVQAVAQKLKELNPEFDGKVSPSIRDGVVEELEFLSDRVADITPVRALSKLRSLICGGKHERRGLLRDLAPLEGLKLTILGCGNSSVSGLSALNGMPLNHLTVHDTEVSDLSPLAGTPLTTLNCRASNVRDLTPLTSTPIQHLSCPNCPITDFSPLAKMSSLRTVDLGSTTISDLSPLKGLPLEWLTLMWTPVTDVSPLAGMPLAYLRLDATKVSDLSPLKGMPLTFLNCSQTPVSDLSPLEGMPLAELVCSNTQVTNLAPLKGLPLEKVTIHNSRISDITPVCGPQLRMLGIQLSQVSELSPLSGTALEHLYCDPEVARKNQKVLAALKSMKRINNVAADQFLRGTPDQGVAEWVLQVGGQLHVDEQEVGSLAALPKTPFKVTSVYLIQNPQATDDAMLRLQSLSALQGVNVSATSIGDRGLGTLAEIKTLRSLSLVSTEITDAGLEPLSKLSRLEALTLNGTNITDEGLKHLAHDPQLTMVNLLKTKVTPAGVQKLAAALPRCRIEWDGGLIEPKTTSNPDRRAAEWVLSLKGRVQIRRENQERSVVDPTDLPTGDFELLTAVTPNNPRVTDAGLASITGCTHLTWLELSHTPVTDAGLAHLRQLAELRHLGLAGTAVTDAGLAHLTEHRTLLAINLDRTQVTGAGLSHLKGLSNLADLRLNATRLTDAGLALLKDFKGLRHIDVRSTQVTDAGIQRLESLTNLEHLDLQETKVTDQGVARLRQALPNCRIAWGDPDRRAAEWVLSVGGSLRGTPDPGRLFSAGDAIPMGEWKLTMINVTGNARATDDALTVFENCRNLNGLYLSDTPVTDAGLTVFKDCPDLLVLELNRTAVTDAGLGVFHDCQRLEQLTLNGTHVTDSGLAPFGKCTNLGRLLLADTHLGDAGLAAFQNCKKLKSLDLKRTKVTAAGLDPIRGYAELAVLSLDGLPIGDSALTIVQDCPELKELNLIGTRVGDTGLEHLQHLKQLGAVRVKQTNVTAAGVQKLAAALPACKIEWDGGVIEPRLTGDPDRRAAEYVLSVGGTVVTRRKDEERSVNAVGDLPLEAFELIKVDLSYREVTDAGLSRFEGCRNIRHLNLYGSGATDAGLAHFKDCQKLEFLDLFHARVTDAGLAAFKECQRLAHLNLDGTAVGDAGMAHFADCHDLAILNLNGTRVGDPGLAAFKDCTKLTYLNLSGLPNVTNVGLANFKDCRQLTHLTLTETKVNDYGLAIFAESRDLARLHVARTPVTDAGLAYFKDFPQLVDLNLGGTRITPAGLAQLPHRNAITSLDLRNTQVTDEALALFKDSRQLTDLILMETAVGDAGLAHFQECRDLTQLFLDGTRVTDAGLERFANCKKLAHVTLTKTQVTEAGVNKLAADVPRCRIVWDRGVIEPH